MVFPAKTLRATGWSLVLGLLMVAGENRSQGQGVDPAVVGERLQRLSATVESLELALESQKRQIDALSGELQQMRERAATQANDHPWADDVRRLENAIAEVDRKRVADGEQTLKILNELRKSIGRLSDSTTTRPAPIRPSPSASGSGTGRSGKASEPATDKALPYAMKRGQTVSELLVEFNADARKRGYQTLTAEQVLEFNHIADARQIPEGATILFPLFPQESER